MKTLQIHNPATGQLVDEIGADDTASVAVKAAAARAAQPIQQFFRTSPSFGRVRKRRFQRFCVHELVPLRLELNDAVLEILDVDSESLLVHSFCSLGQPDFLSQALIGLLQCPELLLEYALNLGILLLNDRQTALLFGQLRFEGLYALVDT